MIYPTRQAVLLTAAGAPLALLVGVVAPGWWLVSVAWIAAMLGLMLADGLISPWPARLEVELDVPRTMGIGRPSRASVSAAFPKAAPKRLELALEVNERLKAPERIIAGVHGRRAEAGFELQPVRRGEGVVERLWARWRGPLGMVWVQRLETLGRRTVVTADVQGIKDHALKMFDRDAMYGVKAQLETGEGSEFHALREFQVGMDLRAIDWKQSARHARLVAKEYRTERNHHVVLALDTGRLMSAPLAGQPRIDRAINAALLLAFVGLKLGDRVGLYAFDSKPRAATGATSGATAFPLIQQLAASLDYSTEETNFTLGLTTLSGRLDRRSLVVVFTEFADPTSAQLMIENVARLVRTHLVLFVVFRDEELQSIVDREPREPDDVTRAVVAAQLQAQREVVIETLRRLGAHIIEAPVERMGSAVVNGYLDIKRRDLI